MPVPGLDWISHSKNFAQFLGRWGAAELSTLGPIFKGVLPTVLVDRFRGPDEADIWVITVENNGAVGENTGLGIVSNDPDSDWELLALTVSLVPHVMLAFNDLGYHLCTPLVGAIDPVQNNFVGGFVPGLITNLAVTSSTLRGFSGTAPGLVLPLGELHRMPYNAYGAPLQAFPISQTTVFDPPLRFYGTRAVIVQALQGAPATQAIPLSASFRYRERPRRANL